MSRSALSDVGAAALVLGLSLGMLASGGLGTHDPDARNLDWAGVLLAAATALPLLGRRVAPLGAYALSGAATITLVGLNYPVDFPFGPVAAVYTVAITYGGDPRRAWRRAAVVLAGSFVPLALGVHAAGGYETEGLAPGLLFWVLAFAAVWIAGDRTRLRRERIGELEERAARTEREAEHERRLAAAQERTRIARELHDSAGHAINVILVQAGAARLLRERDAEGSLRAIATIEDVARATIGEIDRLVHALRDEDDVSPPADPAALDEVVQRHRIGGLDINASTRGNRRVLSRNVAWAAHRILQEALTNAARYGTGTADVGLHFDQTAVEISVTNATAPGRSVRSVGGHGIVGMRERAALLGGTLQASADSGRFRVLARLPYDEPAS